MKHTHWLGLSMILVAGCASPPRQGEPPQFSVRDSVKAVYSLKHNFEQGDQLLLFFDPDSAESYRAKLAAESATLARHADDVGKTVEAMLDLIREPIANLPVASNIRIRVAVRHQPFLDVVPTNLTVESVEGKADIVRTPGGTSHHVCIDRHLLDGPCAAIKFRLPTQGSGGGTPVPYFGVRDESGKEEVLVLFSSYPKQDEIQEILLFRRGDLFGALYNDQVKSVRIKGFGENIYVFFHMNDTSRILIDEVRLPLSNDGNESANKTIDSHR